MNRRLFHRWMTHWALAATLALTLVPSVGRLAGQSAMPMHVMPAGASTGGDSANSGHISHGAHTDRTGAEASAIASAHQHAHTTRDTDDGPPTAGNGHHGSDDDCAYCPLLSGTTALPVPGLPAALPVQGTAVRVPATRTPALDRHPTGLGSRGPPITA